jgi:hypothetical protein
MIRQTIAQGEAAGPRETLETGGRGHRPVHVHLHHPASDWGGALGMLDFQRDRVAGLIERGDNDALNHDCEKGGCVLP